MSEHTTWVRRQRPLAHFGECDQYPAWFVHQQGTLTIAGKIHRRSHTRQLQTVLYHVGWAGSGSTLRFFKYPFTQTQTHRTSHPARQLITHWQQNSTDDINPDNCKPFCNTVGRVLLHVATFQIVIHTTRYELQYIEMIYYSDIDHLVYFHRAHMCPV